MIWILFKVMWVFIIIVVNRLSIRLLVVVMVIVMESWVDCLEHVVLRFLN